MSQNGTSSLCRLAANLRSLAGHLDEIVAGARPTAEDLATAPVLVDWTPRLTPSRALAIAGTVFGHPIIADGETVRADVLAADPDLRWIRGWAGYYRLGAEVAARTDRPVRRRASA